MPEGTPGTASSALANLVVVCSLSVTAVTLPARVTACVSDSIIRVTKFGVFERRPGGSARPGMTVTEHAGLLPPGFRPHIMTLKAGR